MPAGCEQRRGRGVMRAEGGRRVIRAALTVAAALALTGAGVARADDCEPEGWAGQVRSPVTATGGGAVVLATSYEDETFGVLGPGDGVDAYSLSAASARRVHLRGLATSPSLAADVVRWRHDGVLVATPLSGGPDRVLIASLPFPGYAGVAAAKAPDGTITLVYGVPPASGVGPAAIALRRIAPDGTVGPATTLPGVGETVEPKVAVDARGNAFGVVGGDSDGMAVRWPAGRAPQAAPSAALRGGASAVVPDGAGGAWIVFEAGREAHLTTTGLAMSEAAARPGRGERIEAVAIDRHGRAIAVVSRRGRALILHRGRRAIVLRSRRAYTQADVSVTVGAGGRAWVVWEESSDKLDSLCNLYPVHASVRWASVAPHARTTTSRVLRGAPIEETFVPGLVERFGVRFPDRKSTRL